MSSQHSTILCCDKCAPSTKCTLFITQPDDEQIIIVPTGCPNDPNNIPNWKRNEEKIL